MHGTSSVRQDGTLVPQYDQERGLVTKTIHLLTVHFFFSVTIFDILLILVG